MSDDQASQQQERQAAPPKLPAESKWGDAEPAMTDEHRWGEPITAERQAELEGYFHAWAQEAPHRRRLSPFDGVRLTGADVFYLAARTLAGAAGNVAETLERLRRARDDDRLRGTLDLSGLNLWRATLTGALLTTVALDQAHLTRAWLDQADLRAANLTGADLEYAHLRGANLWGATLDQANLITAWLDGANLRACHLDDRTRLANIAWDAHTALGDVIWNGARLTGIRGWYWKPRFGDEDVIANITVRSQRIIAIREAARAYRGLSTALRSQRMDREASCYRLREQRLERQALRLQRHYGAWLFSALLDLVAGYGEKSARTVSAYVVVILGFAGAYYMLGQRMGPPLPPLGALVFSITAFHGRGFFPSSMPSLIDPLVILAAAEAIVGLFIELVFIATFTQRFFAR